ncbi:MAG: CapA family protein [Bacteroidales bacterium]|nr:CapA family protein [Bacteroidales bacterium]
MKRCLLLLLPALLAVGQPKAAAQPLPAPARPYWTFSLPAPRPIDAADTLTLRFIGDVMMHRPQLKHDYTAFFRHVAAPMRSADIAVANMEFPLAGPPYTGYPSFSAPDAYAWTVCADLSLDVALLSNNHILDKGRGGVERTLEVYDAVRDSLGTLRTGVSRDAAEDAVMHPALIRRKGISVAFVNFTYGNNVGPQPFDRPRIAVMEEEEVAALVARARGRGADFVIALPHWGEEYHLRHSREQETWARRLASWGVDAVVGAHPHVVQDTACVSGMPVVYSLGNAVSNMSAPNTRLELMATLRLVRHPSGRCEVLPPDLRFMWCTLPGKLTGGYAVIFVDEWEGRRDAWADPSDYDEMMATLARVKAATGIR